MKLNITPLHDRIVIEPSPVSNTTKAGIIIPDTAKEKPLQGKVMAVGGGTNENKLTVKVNDTVLYGKHAGTDIEVDGKMYLIMKESDILAII